MFAPAIFLARARVAGFRAAAWRTSLVIFADFRPGVAILLLAGAFLVFAFALLTADLIGFFMATLALGHDKARANLRARCRSERFCSRPFLPEELVPSVFGSLQFGRLRLETLRGAPRLGFRGQGGGETLTEPGFEA